MELRKKLGSAQADSCNHEPRNQQVIDWQTLGHCKHCKHVPTVKRWGREIHLLGSVCIVPLSSGQSALVGWLQMAFDGPGLSDDEVQWFEESASEREGRVGGAGCSRWFFLLSSFLWLWLFSLYGDFLWVEDTLSACRRCWGAPASGSGECLLPELFSSWQAGASPSEPSTEMGPSLSEKGSASDSSSDLGESGTSGALEDS